MSWATTFHSGMSSSSDLQGCIDAGAPIGVVAGLLTNTQLFLSLPKYLDRGGKVFVDSGAFGAFRKGEETNWARVLTAYQCIIGSTKNAAGLSIVAPDIVGDQAGTVKLWTEHAALIKSWILAGARVIMPLQTGTLPPQELLSYAIQLVGKTFAAGIPSNLAAMPAAECGSITHHDFHILGRVVINDEVKEKIDSLRKKNPLATMTADANWLRSRTSKLKAIPTSCPSVSNGLRSRRAQAVASLLASEMYRFAQT